MDCIFCKIVNRENPATIVYEDKDFLAFKDIRPKAATHLLIIPKKHIESIKSLNQSEADLIGRLILTAKKIAAEKGLAGYKLVFNVGREGGQIVDHIHLHLLAGKRIDLP